VFSLGFVVPPSAKNPECASRGGLGYSDVALRFDMLPSDLAAFLSSTGVKTPLSGDPLPDYVYTEFLGLLNSKSIKSHLYGHYSPEGVVGENILIDTSDPNRYIVYIGGFAS
jgi:hypothetical protein